MRRSNLTQSKPLVRPPDPNSLGCPFIVESELPWDPQPEKFTDGVETWEDFGHEINTLPAVRTIDATQVVVPDDADTTVYDVSPHVVHVPTYVNIEEQLRARGFYNVPATVIERLEEEARKLVEAARMPGRIDAEVNAQPEFDEVLDTRLLRDSADMEPVVRNISRYIQTAEGLGANEGNLCVDLTAEEWSWLVTYSMYYTGGSNTAARFHDASWTMRAHHPGFRNRKSVVFTHTTSETEESRQAAARDAERQAKLRQSLGLPC